MNLRQLILDHLAEKSGNTTYPELHAVVPFEFRRELPSELKALRKSGVTGEVVEATPQGNVHKIWLVQAGE